MNNTSFTNETFLNFNDTDILRGQQIALNTVRDKFDNLYHSYINGKWVQGEAGTLKSINPGNTDEYVAHFSLVSQSQATHALGCAWQAFETWRYTDAKKRANYLFKAADVVRRRRLEINAWMISEAGKNYAEADGDTAEGIDFLVYYAQQALRLAKGMTTIDSENERNKTIYTPIGSGVSISPWNFPFAICLGMVAAPIAAGNCVVAKPASFTPLIGRLIAEIFEEVDLPKGVFNLVVTHPTVGQHLVTHPDTRFINFTGSLKIGTLLTELVAKYSPEQHFIKRILTELGGKNAMVIDDDAHIELAADAIVAAAFGYQGQKCSAASRVIAVEKVYDKVLEAVLEKTKKLSIGNPKDNYNVGPVISESAMNGIMNYINIGKKEHKLVLGGEPAQCENPGYYIQPTIFDNVEPNSRIAQEEIFGPVTAFIKAKDTHHALNIANNTKYGLTGGYFSNDPEKIDNALRKFYVGNLYINRKCTGALVGAQPFGGFKMSGTDAKAGGQDYLLYFLEPKSMTVRNMEGVNYRLPNFKYDNIL